MNNTETKPKPKFKGFRKSKSRKKSRTTKKKNTFHNMCITRKNAMDNAIKEYNRVCRRLPSLPKNEGEYARLYSPRNKTGNYAKLNRKLNKPKTYHRYPATHPPVPLIKQNNNTLYETINK